MILIPAWIIALLTGIVAVDCFLRFREERNLLLIGKIISWGMATIVYATISLGIWDVAEARAFSRLAWVFVPLTEIAYRYAKVKWSI